MVQYRFLNMMISSVVLNLARTVLSNERQAAFKEEHLGRIIIYCEGQTEKQYFEYFASIIKKSKFDDIQVVIENASGNASRVYKYAQWHLEEEANNRKYMNYKKYLVFDCDAPEHVQEIIQQASESCEQFVMLLSNAMFEVWLLMHFERVTLPLRKGELMSRLSTHLHHEYNKASAGVVREILSNGDVNLAIENATAICGEYENSGKHVTQNIFEMNPYTTVHLLVEQFVGRIS